MSKITSLILELEEQKIIEWSEELGFYVSTTGDTTVPFDFNPILLYRTIQVDNKDGTEQETDHW